MAHPTCPPTKCHFQRASCSLFTLLDLMLMPLFISALPLSLKTFWRYLLLLPFLGLGALLFSLAGLIPVLGLLVPGAITAGLTLIGLRCALAARGHGGDLDFGRFVLTCLVFSLITMVLGFLGSAANSALTWTFHQAGLIPNPLALKKVLFTLSPLSVTIYSIALFAQVMLACVLTVPMTAAAASASRRGPDSGAFFGLGVGMLGLSVPFLVWILVGNFLSFFGEVGAMFFLLIGTLASYSNGSDISAIWEIRYISLFGNTLAMAWASSWFFATAVLYWERAMETRTQSSRARAETARTSSTDIRALRQAREQQNLQPR